MSTLPIIEFTNLYSSDPIGKKLWDYWLGAKKHKELRPHFEHFGKMAADATPHSAKADQEPPQLISHSKNGERIDKIEYHPSYLELQKMSYGQGLLSLKYDPLFLSQHKGCRHTLGFALGYYFAQTEPGLFCPICMTDALGRVLETHNTHPMAKETLKRMSSKNINELWQGAMFLTEIQGGSDVGANLCRAEEHNGRWFLSGDKWFCSNADAKAILALARMPGEDGALSKGTRGLGLFLILREYPTQNYQTWITHRLKNKLGVRSMASGEITFNKTEAYLIGGANEGFKIMTEMVNMSRIYNSVASVAIARRAVMEAYAFGSQRKAFGSTLTELPLWRASMADLAAEHLGHLLLTFEAVVQLDKSDHANAKASQLLRSLTPLAKATTGKFAVFAASEAMELIGGNAYIEEHILPRLLRDAHVMPIWEGTTNIQSLDFLRLLTKEGASCLLERCEDALGPKVQDEYYDVLTHKVAALEQLLSDSKKRSIDDLQRSSRELLETSARTLIFCLLYETSRTPELADVCLASLKRLLSRPSNTFGLAAHGNINLKDTESCLLENII